MEDNNEEKALSFLGTMRGQFIMGQALQIAIETMESVEPEFLRETSNIEDMKFLRDNLFNVGAALYQARETFGDWGKTQDEMGASHDS